VTTGPSFCRCGKKIYIYIFFISGIFQILIRGKTDRTFNSFVSLIENLPEEEQKKQPYNIELRQDVVVTVTQANQEVMSENAGTKRITRS
jgi:hypothetical protein